MPVEVKESARGYEIYGLRNPHTYDRTRFKGIDAIFKLKETVFEKGGQFIFSIDHVKQHFYISPVIHHPVHNPRGIIDISHCNLEDDEAKELIEKIEAAGNMIKNLMSVERPPKPTTTHDLLTIEADGDRILLHVLGSILILVAITVILVSLTLLIMKMWKDLKKVWSDIDNVILLRHNKLNQD